MLLKGANDLGQKGRSEPNQNKKRSWVSEEHDKEFRKGKKTRPVLKNRMKKKQKIIFHFCKI